MIIKIEYNKDRIRNMDVLNEAIDLFNNKTKQCFLRSKGESEFKKFKEDSIIKDAKLVEMHIKKENGKGEIKLNGNLSYNNFTKEIKFYVLSVIPFDNFKYDEKTYVEVINEPCESNEIAISELRSAIKQMEDTKPKYSPPRRNPNNRNGNSNSNRSSSGKNKNSNYKGKK